MVSEGMDNLVYVYRYIASHSALPCLGLGLGYPVISQ